MSKTIYVLPNAPWEELPRLGATALEIPTEPLYPQTPV